MLDDRSLSKVGAEKNLRRLYRFIMNIHFCCDFFNIIKYCVVWTGNVENQRNFSSYANFLCVAPFQKLVDKFS